MADYQVETITKEPSTMTMDNLNILTIRWKEMKNIQKLEMMFKLREIYFSHKEISMINNLNSLVSVIIFDSELYRIVRMEMLHHLVDFTGLLSENKKLRVFQMSKNMVEFVTDWETVDHLGLTQNGLVNWKNLEKNNWKKRFNVVFTEVKLLAKDIRYRSALPDILPQVLCAGNGGSRLLKD